MVVDDEELLRSSLEKIFVKEGFDVILAKDGKEALKLFNSYFPEITLLDIRLPDIDGIELLKKMKNLDKDSIVIMMTAYGGIKGAVDSIRAGAFDYLTKPFDKEELKFVISKALEKFKMDKELEVYHKKEEVVDFKDILTKNPNMLRICEIAKKVARKGTSPVLLQGESGTGKELLAKALHYSSPRKDKPFIICNCAAIPHTLLESELFGHEKGAFTGALKKKRGLFELADGGTIFLDEIGEIDLSLQVKLLRAIEEHSFYRVGGSVPIQVDVWVIAATNKNLEEQVKEGNFREDLYYRLKVIPITLPPLRERKEDIPYLVRHFLKEFSKEFKCKEKRFSKEAMEILKSYHWKGNIRELKNVVERVVLLCEDDVIRPYDLPYEIRKNSFRDERIEFSQNLLPLDDMVRIYAKKILDIFDGNKTKAAKALGITRNRLRRILN